MAMTAVLSAMNGGQSLHPFFRKLNGQQDTDTLSSIDDVDPTYGVDGACEESGNESQVNKKRKPKKAILGDNKTQKTIQELVKPRRDGPEAPPKYDGQEIPNSCSSDHIYEPMPKRRRVSPIEVAEDPKSRADLAETTANGSVTTPRRAPSPQVLIPASSPPPVIAHEGASDPHPAAPKKMLRLNASGKFSSPPSKKPKDEQPEMEAPRRRGRPRKSKEAVEKRSMDVVLKYATDGDLGQRIDRIMGGEERFHKEVKMTPKKQRTPCKQNPSKPTHPFFTGKAREQASAPKHESPRKASAVTPGKLRRQTMSFGRSAGANEASDTWVSALHKDRLMMRHPGAMEPAWPNREQAHVRGLDGIEQDVGAGVFSLQRRKRKTAKRALAPQESLLFQFAAQLEPETEGKLRSDGFREPHPSLRLPHRLLISGNEILQHAAKELSYAQLDDVVDELSLPDARQADSHTAIVRLRQRNLSQLTAFDEGRGEIHDWPQKYAPSTTAEVLQPSKEMNVLKTWLSSLTVSAVESAATKQDSTHATKLEQRPRKKRRRKNKDLDDFLVDSDEDIHDMDALSDQEDGPLRPTGPRGAKSIVQASGDGIKLSNAVLLTGPHGCGKTAAAYAVAKELGFKVFEISSSERRSGKDVLDKVGDMAENHLVKHHGTESAEVSAAEEPSRHEEAFQRDLASGRQGKMDAFFSSKPKAKNASPKKQQVAKPMVKAIEQIQRAVKKAPKDQQQSLILIEEVDILFKEDKDFWPTVLKLMSTSKRPFIMTCNDEDLVPLQAMTLHAILRFSPPPIDLATDYMVLMAAAEGHLIKREAVSSLYRTKHADLRAAICELSFWCQMGIGDPRSGLSWIYQRYPPGSDLDQHGRRLRVVSQGSFTTGMSDSPDERLAEEDQALWGAKALGIDPVLGTGWNSILDVQSDVLSTLKRYESYAASMSAADVYTALRDTTFLDTSQPPMPDKTRFQYVEGMALLQTDEYTRYDSLLEEFAVASSLVARRVAGVAPPAPPQIGAEACDRVSPTNVDIASLSRKDFACFDAISIPAESALSSSPGLAQSIFDGPLAPIALDLAPYVRSILQYEAALLEQRDRLSSILGDGRSAKRARTTRAARSALQGSQRSLTRRERWFSKNLDVAGVLATAGIDWPKATASLDEVESREGTETPSPSAEST